MRISRQSAQFWKCQRYHFVTAFESKPLLAPPLVVFSHVFMVVKYAIRLCLRKKIKFDRKLSKYNDEINPQFLYFRTKFYCFLLNTIRRRVVSQRRNDSAFARLRGTVLSFVQLQSGRVQSRSHGGESQSY